MTEKEYLVYLGKLADLDVNPDNEDKAEQLYGFFQCFMPSGKNVEKVFEPLKGGPELYSRLMPVYNATSSQVEQAFNEGLSPGYFTPVPHEDSKQLVEYGKLYIDNLKEFAVFIEDPELLDLLNDITDVVIDKEPDTNTEINDYLYDAISDWAIANEAEDDLTAVLSEAYYSINCDYYLSYYFQYPVMKNKPETDIFEPYFKIWELGYYCKFDNTRLVLYP